MERGSGATPPPASGELSPIQIEQGAFLDIEESSSWYESQQPGLGAEFVLELDRLLEAVGSNPSAYSQVYRNFRRALVRRFPYAVYFMHRSGSIYIYAVLHQHRSSEAVASRLT